MNPLQKALFDRLAPLESLGTVAPKCKICAADTVFFDSVDFFKHCSALPYRFGFSGIGVSYYRCVRCSFIFTDLIDDWSSEEIARYIYNHDYLKVDPEYLSMRPLRAAEEMSRHLAGCERCRILDYGSGSGVFAHRMRELGFSGIESYDPFSSPTEPGGPFDLITCFEVIEHSHKPLATIRYMASKLSSDGAIVIGQTLQPGNIEELLGSWWYIGPRNGHVSLFAEETFITLAGQVELTYHRGTGLYAFSTNRPSKPVANFVKKVGLAVQLRTLTAPGPSAATADWHGIEQRGTRNYRWSATSNISWPTIDLGIGINLIHVPFLMAIRPGFESECSLLVDGKKVETRIQSRRITAEVITSKARPCRITLVTPPLRTPHELSGVPDNRRLGLAVEVV